MDTPKKNKSPMGWIIAVIILLLVIGGILYFKPFTSQKRAWLTTHATKSFDATDIEKMSDAEIAVVYTAYTQYNNADETAMSKNPSLQNQFNDISEKYNTDDSSIV